MECNKEEALRAREIAEQKMQSKDFIGAKKVVLKAQQLFPSLDSISQMLTICDVHCSSEIKINGETDWYAILQVEPTADDSYIKKQYRKLALLLHPDKNKFSGAEAAFKLIGEAHMTLSDPMKRSVHDNKRKITIRKPPSQSSNRASKKQTWPTHIPNNTAAQVNGTNLQQQHASTFTGTPTFWTACPFCNMRSQFYTNILGRAIRCPGCIKPFIAYDMNAQTGGAPKGNYSSMSNQPGASQPGFPGHYASNASQQSHPGNAFSGMSFQGNVNARFNVPQTSSTAGSTAEKWSGPTKKTEDSKADKTGGAANEVRFEEMKPKEAKKNEKVAKTSAAGIGQKRGRKIVESSDSDSSDSDSTDDEEIPLEEVNLKDLNAGSTRRSTRQKGNVVYNENVSDDDDFAAASYKRLRKEGSSSKINRQKENLHCMDSTQKVKKSRQQSGTRESEKVKDKEAACSNGVGVDSTVDAPQDADSFSYPDPEFYDFEKDKDVSKFAADQIWAVYDDCDGMPRYYARIRSINKSHFKVYFTWLEYNPVDENESAWFEKELPVACGNYTLGKTESTQDRLTFSHLMNWEKATRRNSYDIYPRKGEVWALFKGWDMSWISDANPDRVHEYEIVEVLSDYAEGGSFCVIRLVRVKGFVCLFMRVEDVDLATLTVPVGEFLRFSHRVPSYRLTGDERDGLLEGSFELDSASLPADIEKAFPGVSLGESGIKSASATVKPVSETVNKTAESGDNILEGKNLSRGFSPKETGEEHRKENEVQYRTANRDNIAENETMAPEKMVGENAKIGGQSSHANDADGHHHPSPLASASPEADPYPESEFYDFTEERSIDSFQPGQIWALYSEINQFPNYYGQIKKVEVKVGKVHMKWLDASSVQKEAAHWLEQDIPIACGIFKVSRETVTFDLNAFSHLVPAKLSKRKDQYDIFPSVGEVWAIYKEWSVEWTSSNLETCEYDIVEVFEQTSSGVKAFVLTQVVGFKTVFMPETGAGTKITVEIKLSDSLRFSHRIPSFRLTEERGGQLDGCLELDPASVPKNFFV